MNGPATWRVCNSQAVQPLTHNQGNAATGGIWRVGEPGGTAILKVAHPPADPPRGTPAWATSDEPTHWNYWRREVLAYTTGFAATVYADAGIVAPEVIRVHERSDGSVALWLADATGTPGMEWTVARLADFARQLGHAQGEWAGRVPDLPWLSRRWLSQYLEGRGLWIPGDVDWDHPLAKVWPDPVRETLANMWPRRQELLARALVSPRTVCHLDVWPMNLVEAGSTTVLFDWSFCGEGGLGEDIANFIVDSVADGLIDMAWLPAINEQVTDAYVEGLREGGWTGWADDVRNAIRAYGAAKYAWFGARVLWRVLNEGTFGHPQYGQDATGQQAMQRLAPLVTMLAEWARSAG
jgi:hypothetical protein